MDLQGKKILITREKSQAILFAEKIKGAGGEPFITPLLEFNYPKITDMAEKLARAKWIFFTSANGVKGFFQNIADPAMLSHYKFATVGNKTARSLAAFGYASNFTPTVYSADVMLTEFFEEFPEANHILLVQGNLSLQLLENVFSQYKIDFAKVIVYETIVNQQIQEELDHILSVESIDFLTFTSPSAVKAFFESIDKKYLDLVLQIPAVCIGKTTESLAKEYNFKEIITASVYTVEGMLDAMNYYLAK